MTNRRIVLMGFGLAGNHSDGFDGGRTFTSTWYVKPEDLQKRIDDGSYPKGEMEGCTLINKRPALEKDMSLAYSSPMVNINLADGERQRAADIIGNPTSNLVLRGIAEYQPSIGLMAAKAATDDTFIGLDNVGIAEYVEWWRSRGAIIGKVEKGKVIWAEAEGT